MCVWGGVDDYRRCYVIGEKFDVTVFDVNSPLLKLLLVLVVSIHQSIQLNLKLSLSHYSKNSNCVKIMSEIS